MNLAGLVRVGEVLREVDLPPWLSLFSEAEKMGVGVETKKTNKTKRIAQRRLSVTHHMVDW